MSWSEIKKAINSTVGTGSFKPLDKIIGEAMQSVIDRLNSLKEKLTNGKNEFSVLDSKKSNSVRAIEIDGEDIAGDGVYVERESAGMYIVNFSTSSNMVRVLTFVLYVDPKTVGTSRVQSVQRIGNETCYVWYEDGYIKSSVVNDNGTTTAGIKDKIYFVETFY